MVKLQIQCNVCGKVFWSKCTRLRNVHPKVIIPVNVMCKKCENAMKHSEQLGRNGEKDVKAIAKQWKYDETVDDKLEKLWRERMAVIMNEKKRNRKNEMGINNKNDVKQAKRMMEKEDYEPDTLTTYHGED